MNPKVFGLKSLILNQYAVQVAGYYWGAALDLKARHRLVLQFAHLPLFGFWLSGDTRGRHEQFGLCHVLFIVTCNLGRLVGGVAAAVV